MHDEKTGGQQGERAPQTVPGTDENASAGLGRGMRPAGMSDFQWQRALQRRVQEHAGKDAQTERPTVADDLYRDLPLIAKGNVQFANLIGSFGVGFFQAAGKMEIPPAAIEEARREIHDPLSLPMMIAGFRTGVPVGAWRDLKANASTIYAIVKWLAVHTGVPGVGVAKEAVKLALHPIEEMARLRADATAEQQKIASLYSGLTALIGKFENDPAFLFAIGDDLGRAAGEQAATWFANEFMTAPPFEKGNMVGVGMGYAAMEILLLVLGPEELLAKAPAWAARLAGRGSKIAERLLKLADEIPGLKALFQPLARTGKEGEEITALAKVEKGGNELGNAGKLLEQGSGGESRVLEGDRETAKGEKAVGEIDVKAELARVRAGGNYAERQALMERFPTIKSHQAFTIGEVPEDWEAMQQFLKNPANWIPERRALHAELLDATYAKAVKLSEGMPEHTVVMMRGNTASGKSYSIAHSEVPSIKALKLGEAGKARPGILNPDDLKFELSQLGGKGTSTQVHMEGSSLATQVIDRLLAEGKSIAIDKRFLVAEHLQTEIVTKAKIAGYRTVLIDVDAELGTSAERVAQRSIGGPDPNVPWSVVEEGFDDARTERKAVAELDGIDEYVLVKTDGPKRGTTIAEKTSGKLKIHDAELWNDVTHSQKADVLQARGKYKATLDDRAARTR